MADQFYLVRLLVAEDENLAAATIMAQHMGNQSHQPVDTGPEIYGLGRNVNPHATVDRDHARMASSTARKREASTSPSTRTVTSRIVSSSLPVPGTG